MADYATRRIMMVDTQVRPSDVTKFPIIEAMLHVPREVYLPAGLREIAYVGENIAVGHGRVMLDPRTLAKMLDALDLQREDVVLDLGCVQGYTTAVIARLVEFVVAVEPQEDWAHEAQSTLSEQGVDNAAVITGDLTQGAAKSGPYDAIIIQGAVQQVPDTLLAQLKDGGRIAAVFAEGALGVVRIGHKLDGRVDWRLAFNAGAPVLDGFHAQDAFVL
ncbi:MAG: protein-L-isoaspartate O-methyltransferase [Rhodobacterales bacterium]|nr:protein-L-isoaspartate O-methyltransferase [Rhodobacterales bacterium]NCT12968.1 protein-L-isoaspartate O-methyltransferase [Rhodobacterales bacterium]